MNTYSNHHAYEFNDYYLLIGCFCQSNTELYFYIKYSCLCLNIHLHIPDMLVKNSPANLIKSMYLIHKEKI